MPWPIRTTFHSPKGLPHANRHYPRRPAVYRAGSRGDHELGGVHRHKHVRSH